MPPMPRMRPFCSIAAAGFDFSGCGDGTSCPPSKQAEKSNSEATAIVLQGFPRIPELYLFHSKENAGRWALEADSIKRPIPYCLAGPVAGGFAGVAAGGLAGAGAM